MGIKAGLFLNMGGAIAGDAIKDNEGRHPEQGLRECS